MATITLFNFETTKNKKEIISLLNKYSSENTWIIAKDYGNEIKGIFNMYLNITEELRKVLEPWEMENIKVNGNGKILRSILFYIDFKRKIIEIHRGSDALTRKLKEILEEILQTKLKEFYIDHKTLHNIIKNYSLELRQAYFKFVNGFLYENYKGRFLERNEHFKEILKERLKNLRIITIVPKVFPIINKQVTINGDKGTLKFSNGAEIARNEVKSIIDLIFKAMGEKCM